MMPLQVVKMTVALYILILGYVIFVANGELWHKVAVSEARLNDLLKTQMTDDKEVRPNLQRPYLPCSHMCSSLPWCDLFCYKSTANLCLFYEVIVKPGFKETNMADALLCYTNHQNNYAVGVFINGTPVEANLNTRVLENLVDGYYGFKMGECYQSDDGYRDPWYYIDLGGVVPVTSVTLIMQSNTGGFHQFDYEVRLHPDGSAPTDPGAGIFVGGFKDPATPSQKIIMEKNPATMARYVTVQRFSLATCTPANCIMMMCHIEVA